MALKKVFVCAGLAWSVTGGAECALAQSTGGVTPFTQTGAASGLGGGVVGRPNPEYDPSGVRLGVWMLYPSLSVQTVYNDNIYEVRNAVADVSETIQPQLVLTNKQANYTINIVGSGTFNEYSKLTTEDSNLYSFRANGAYQISVATSANASVSYGRQVEPRGTSGDTIIGGTPIEYQLASATAGINQDVGNFFFNVQGSGSKYNYDDVRFKGQSISQLYRNVSEYSVTGQVGYSLNGAVALYTSVSYTRQEYTKNASVNQNGESFTAIGGVQFSITSLLSGRVGIGIINVNFDNPLYGEASGLNYDVALQWNPTELISFSVTGTRSLSRSPVESAGGLIESGIAVTSDYELLRNLIVSGSVGESEDKYQGIAITNTRWNEALSIRYKRSRLMAVTLSASAVQQKSGNAAGRRYGGQTGSLGLLFHI